MSDIKIGGTRTLKILDANYAFVSSSARFDGSDSKQKFGVVGAKGMDYSRLNGTITGTERVERSSGLALETNVNTVLKGRVFARAKGNARASAPKHETPVNVTSTTRVVLEPRSLS